MAITKRLFLFFRFRFPDFAVFSSSFAAKTVVVAQSVELQIVILAVAGSNPVDHPIFPTSRLRVRFFRMLPGQSMTPEMRELLKQKQARRVRLAALPYPEKVRIVVQLQNAALRIRAATKTLR